VVNLRAKAPNARAAGAEHEFLDRRDGVEYQQSLARTYGTVVRVPRGFFKVCRLRQRQGFRHECRRH